MKHSLSLGIVLELLLTVGACGQPVDEYEAKAAFLYNFALFVKWPANSFTSSKDPITICILGRNPFGHALEEAVRGKVVEGRSFIIRQVSDARPPCGCQILFVNSSERKRFRSMAGTLQGAAVLTVGEAAEFTADGGVINLKLERGRVRLEINLEAAGREEYRISSKLLSLAQIVKK
jgi:hypothetical protein